MNKKKIYLAGKVSGLTSIEASQKFGKVEKQLMDEGYEVINPLNLVDFNDTWENAMRICIKAMMDCDEVYFMKCWKDSKGACIERIIAEKLEFLFHKDSH